MKRISYKESEINHFFLVKLSRALHKLLISIYYHHTIVWITKLWKYVTKSLVIF